MLFSCVKETETITAEEPEVRDMETVEPSVDDPDYELKQLIGEYDKKMKRSGALIFAVKKVNMGISGCENILTAWKYNDLNYDDSIKPLYVYVVDGTAVRKKYYVPCLADNSDYFTYDIMKMIPGEPFAQTLAKIHDYTEDGFDDVFLMTAWGGIDTPAIICGYDSGTDEIVRYFEAPYIMDETVENFLPVQFIPYEDYNGFRITFKDSDDGSYHWNYHYWVSELDRFGGPDHYTPPDGKGY
jgi:hypothetical protein